MNVSVTVTGISNCLSQIDLNMPYHGLLEKKQFGGGIQASEQDCLEIAYYRSVGTTTFKCITFPKELWITVTNKTFIQIPF